MLKIGQDDVKTAENLVEKLAVCQLSEKLDYVVYLLKKHACRCIVFATRVCDVQKLFFTMKALSLQVCMLNGQMAQRERNLSFEQFKSGIS